MSRTAHNHSNLCWDSVVIEHLQTSEAGNVIAEGADDSARPKRKTTPAIAADIAANW